VDFTRADMPVLTGEQTDQGAVYRTDAPEFELSRLEWGAFDQESAVHSGRVDTEIVVDCSGPQILLCTAGAVTVTAQNGAEILLRRGQSLWLAAADSAVRIRQVGGQDGTEHAQLFRATAGTSL
jgi:mannose-6-phosphate isomerase